MGKMQLTEVKENENGDVTWAFDLDEKSAVTMAELGLKLVLYCSAYGISTQEVFEDILPEVKKRKAETEEITSEQDEMSSPGDKDYEI